MSLGGLSHKQKVRDNTENAVGVGACMGTAPASWEMVRLLVARLLAKGFCRRRGHRRHPLVSRYRRRSAGRLLAAGWLLAGCWLAGYSSWVATG